MWSETKVQVMSQAMAFKDLTSKFYFQNVFNIFPKRMREQNCLSKDNNIIQSV